MAVRCFVYALTHGWTFRFPPFGSYELCFREHSCTSTAFNSFGGPFALFSVLLFETGPHPVVQAGLKLTMQPQLALNEVLSFN